MTLPIVLSGLARHPICHHNVSAVHWVSTFRINLSRNKEDLVVVAEEIVNTQNLCKCKAELHVEMWRKRGVCKLASLLGGTDKTTQNNRGLLT